MKEIRILGNSNGNNGTRGYQSYQPNGRQQQEPPPLSLRLGCDVPRQVARTEANAALTCKRMEEALERQNDLPARKRVLDDETLEEATSMSEIALRPLGHGDLAVINLKVRKGAVGLQALE